VKASQCPFKKGRKNLWTAIAPFGMGTVGLPGAIGAGTSPGTGAAVLNAGGQRHRGRAFAGDVQVGCASTILDRSKEIARRFDTLLEMPTSFFAHKQARRYLERNGLTAEELLRGKAPD